MKHRKLTDEQVTEINHALAMGASCVDVAFRYNVSPSLIHLMKKELKSAAEKTSNAQHVAGPRFTTPTEGNIL
jgi:hypothetical protein